MKQNLFPRILLLIALTAVLAMGQWWVRHRVSPLKQPLLPVAKQAEPEAVPATKPINLVTANAPKLAMVAAKPSGMRSLPLRPEMTASAWSAARKVVDTHGDYDERLAAARSLSGSLTTADWGVLQPFLLKPDALDGDQLGQALKNELLNKLCALNPPPADLEDVLAKMYRDPQQDEVIRDYAVQHLATYYEGLAGQPNNLKTQQALVNVLQEAVNETSDSIGGTALRALRQLSQEYPADFDQDNLAATTLKMANDNSAGELTHITAFQVCAQLGMADALPVVLQAAQNGETISVKLSAIGALGSLGGRAQIPFLNNVLTGTENRLWPAAQHALDQIMARQPN